MPKTQKTSPSELPSVHGGTSTALELMIKPRHIASRLLKVGPRSTQGLGGKATRDSGRVQGIGTPTFQAPRATFDDLERVRLDVNQKSYRGLPLDSRIGRVAPFLNHTLRGIPNID